jgi:ankyrin repeat protein
MTHEGFDMPSQGPLHLAAKGGHYSTVQLLLAHDASPIIVRSKEGRTPLDYAASGYHVRVAELLWDRQRQWGSDSSLLEFLKQDQLTAARVLLELLGFDIEKRSRVPEPDIDERQFRHLHGPDWAPTFDDLNHWSPLHYASACGSVEEVSMLLKCGADVHALNSTCQGHLHLAASRFDRRILRVLLDHGAAIDARDVHGESVAHIAARYGNSEGLILLVERGCDTAALDREGWSLLHAGANWLDGRVLGLLLMPKGRLHVNLQDYTGTTPLHVAARKSSAPAVSALLNHGADIEAQDSDGRTPLSVAAQHCSASAAGVLRKRGVNNKARDNHGLSPLSYAGINYARNRAVANRAGEIPEDCWTQVAGL